MDFAFKNIKISGMLGVMPNREIRFEDEMKNFNFPEKSSLKLAKLMGFQSRRVVDEGYTASDLAVYGIEYLIEQELLDKDDISAIIYVSQTPDYIQPPTSNVIQGRLGLGYDVVCMDINQGCAGFGIGLFEAGVLCPAICRTGYNSKLLIINAESGSIYLGKRDRNTTPLFGDAATITVIEKSEVNNQWQFKLKNDGKRYDTLMVPAGGVRMRCSPETAIETLQPDGNYRSLEHAVMKGEEVYNFTMNEAVELIEEMITDSGLLKEQIDYYMLHQPNKFMLQNMAKKLQIPEEKMPNNIVSLFGNSAGAALPINIIYNLGEKLEKQTLKLLLSGFGVGLAWNAAVMDMGVMRFCKMIGHPQF